MASSPLADMRYFLTPEGIAFTSSPSPPRRKPLLRSASPETDPHASCKQERAGLTQEIERLRGLLRAEQAEMARERHRTGLLESDMNDLKLELDKCRKALHGSKSMEREVREIREELERCRSALKASQ
eukprot:Sspe_Gene.89179::Locus_61007_Transcript_1_1_Confidence_1.000_Length_452::g.89179::m.89179